MTWPSRPLPGLGDLYEFGDCFMLKRPQERTMTGYKLFSLKRDGSIGPLFINRKMRLRPGQWYNAESHPTKGYAVRPGWHILAAPSAPHLSQKGRVWAKVEFQGAEAYRRPEAQGGLWYLAQKMRVLEVM